MSQQTANKEGREREGEREERERATHQYTGFYIML